LTRRRSAPDHIEPTKSRRGAAFAATQADRSNTVYVRDKFADTASVLHLPQEVAEKMGNDVERLRVIAVRPSTGTEGIRFAFTQSSEVYVRG